MIIFFKGNWKLLSVLVLLLLAGIANLLITIRVLSHEPSFVFVNTLDDQMSPVSDIVCINEPLIINVKGINRGGWAISTYAETIYHADTLNFAKIFPPPEIAVSGLIDNTTYFNYPIFVDTSGLSPGEYIYALSTEQETKSATGFYTPFEIVNCNP